MLKGSSFTEAGLGTVTSVSVVTANGVSASVATPTTTPAITVTLGAIVPTTVNNVTITAPAAAATLTLANNSSLNTSGAFAITLTSSATTNATLPSGTSTLLNSASAAVSSAVAITGGAIDGVIIGATTPVVAQVQRPINAQTSATYTLVASDQDKMVTMNNASASTLTIPANASVPFPVGTEIDLLQLGAGQVTVAITSDTYTSYTSKTKLAGQYAGGTIKKLTSTGWILVGNLG